MAYQAYANVDYYKNVYQGSVMTDDDAISKALLKASRHIDTLTYNRIVGKGIENLTQFQQELIQEVCCQLADFETENADALDSILQSYSINGVSMTFGESWNVTIRNGVAIKKDLYDELLQTGLCYRGL